MLPLLPRSLGRYLLFDLIGKGGMAEIYLAKARMDLQPLGSRLCVVKEIISELASDRKFSDMLVHEANLAARLSHANVVQVFDLGRADDRLYIAMEYVEGFDLRELRSRCAHARIPLPFDLAVDVVRGALSGLDYAHRRTDDRGVSLGIVHRDVSPSNILLSFEGDVKVCDFGIARANDVVTADEDAGAQDRDRALSGKAGYMSPEQARGEAVDARGDVFAAGIILWELAAGRRLYKASDDRTNLLEQARRADIPPLPARGLPEEGQLRSILEKALAADRDARYPSASAMLRDLDDYAAHANLLRTDLSSRDWLTTTFADEVLARRRSRETALTALEKGAPLVARPVVAGYPKAREPEASSAPATRGAAPATIAPPLNDGEARDGAAHVGPRAHTGRARSLATLALVSVAFVALGVVIAIALR
jgi:eukaryotic-like serine/threonine-protein kinase